MLQILVLRLTLTGSKTYLNNIGFHLCCPRRTNCNFIFLFIKKILFFFLKRKKKDYLSVLVNSSFPADFMTKRKMEAKEIDFYIV
jgi:hypothetical protein